MNEKVYHKLDSMSQIRHLLGFKNGNHILLVLYGIWVHLETGVTFYIQPWIECGVCLHLGLPKRALWPQPQAENQSSLHLVLGTFFKP